MDNGERKESCMCIIAVCKTRALEIDEFSDCWRSNSDGVGMAYPDGKGVWIHKGLMKMSAALEAYRDLTLPHVIHFRSASSGSICRELTHPFIIDKNSEPVYED